MPLDFHDIGQIGAGGAAGGLIGYLTQLYNKMRLDRRFDGLDKKLDIQDEKFEAHALLVAREYVTRTEIKEDFKEIKLALKEISTKLDNKADK